MYSGLRMLLLERESINIKERLSLEREIVKYSSASLSLTTGMNEKVEQHIRKKTANLIPQDFGLKVMS